MLNSLWSRSASAAVTPGSAGVSTSCIPHSPGTSRLIWHVVLVKMAEMQKRVPKTDKHISQSHFFYVCWCLIDWKKSHGQAQSQGLRIYYPLSSPTKEAMARKLGAKRCEVLWSINQSITCSYCYKIRKKLWKT